MSDCCNKATKSIADAVIGDFIHAGCLEHLRLKFQEVKNSFPEEVAYLLAEIKKVYKNEKKIKKENLDSDQRLKYHQEHSKPIMDGLFAWAQRLLDEHLVEENSELGKRLNYLLSHDVMFTRFLEVAGVPLDNNIDEMTIKTTVRHRNNSRKYQTQAGADKGDLFMSLIKSVEFMGDNPYEYLVFCATYKDLIEDTPEDFTPWNWRETQTRLNSNLAPPSNSS